MKPLATKVKMHTAQFQNAPVLRLSGWSDELLVFLITWGTVCLCCVSSKPKVKMSQPRVASAPCADPTSAGPKTWCWNSLGATCEDGGLGQSVMLQVSIAQCHNYIGPSRIMLYRLHWSMLVPEVNWNGFRAWYNIWNVQYRNAKKIRKPFISVLENQNA